ncbi:hypothetical protein PM10SUCC1_22410 [Propionigenium maris DSM 9537]|uniref:Uncharacterized protein n=1 Tax=Propionigenium maris DSM 9537 TaxID=1123000 RepID=A0A9W6GNC2_9FUSO|nr:hypothetical protein [Propionigenium maris]GLI56727.1 hypothetical protein PM10SUCC1_22410 [Propionigenium maris DSM 9537]
MKKLILVAVFVLRVTTHSRLLVTDIEGEERIYARNTPQGTRYYPHFRSEKQLAILIEDNKIHYLYPNDRRRRPEYNIRATRGGAIVYEGRSRNNPLHNSREVNGVLRIYTGGNKANHIYTLRNNGNTWLLYRGSSVSNPVARLERQGGRHTPVHLMSALVQAGYLKT